MTDANFVDCSVAVEVSLDELVCNDSVSCGGRFNVSVSCGSRLVRVILNTPVD